jgi:hypothetical protein
MDHSCVVFPLLPRKTEEARAFQHEFDTTRTSDYDRSERRIGITKEYGFVASVPGAISSWSPSRAPTSPVPLGSSAPLRTSSISGSSSDSRR